MIYIKEIEEALEIIKDANRENTSVYNEAINCVDLISGDKILEKQVEEYDTYLQRDHHSISQKKLRQQFPIEMYHPN